MTEKERVLTVLKKKSVKELGFVVLSFRPLSVIPGERIGCLWNETLVRPPFELIGRATKKDWKQFESIGLQCGLPKAEVPKDKHELWRAAPRKKVTSSAATERNRE